MAGGVVLFLLPNQLSSGGFSGITTVLYYLFNFKVGTMTLIMNLPLFAIAYFKVGKRFLAKALFGTIVFSLCLDLFEHFQSNLIVPTQDKLLASIYGGIVVGVRKCNNTKKQRFNRRHRTTQQYNIKNKQNIQNRNINGNTRRSDSNAKYDSTKTNRNRSLFGNINIYNKQNNRIPRRRNKLHKNDIHSIGQIWRNIKRNKR